MRVHVHFLPLETLDCGTAGVLGLLLVAFGSWNPVLGQVTIPNEEPAVQIARQAQADLQNHKLDLAVEEYRKLLSLDPANVNAHANLGVAYYLQKQFDQAAEQFETSLHAQPDLWNISALCGFSEKQLGRNSKAIIYLTQAFEHVDDHGLRFAAGKQLFSLLFEAGELRKSADVVDRLRKLEPENAEILYAAHQVYSSQATEVFLSMARLRPDSPQMYQIMGDQMAQLGNIQGAISAYRQVLSRDPHLPGAHYELGQLLSTSPSAPQRALAQAEFQQALIDNPLDEKAECGLGDLEMERSNLNGASEHYKRALELQPNDAEANEGLGMVLLAMNSNQEASTYLNRAVQLDPTNVTGHYHLSQVSRKIGDLDAAKREMQEFLKLKAQKETLEHTFHDLRTQGNQQTQHAPDNHATTGAAPESKTAGQSKN